MGAEEGEGTTVSLKADSLKIAVKLQFQKQVGNLSLQFMFDQPTVIFRPTYNLYVSDESCYQPEFQFLFLKVVVTPSLR